MSAPSHPQPWGRASSLLAGCATTATGIGLGLDPDVILWRTTVSAVVVGAAVSLLVRLLRQWLDEV